MLELGRRIRVQEVPREVVEAATRLAQHPEKLLYLVLEADAAPGPGTPNLNPGLHPSDLLLELVTAARAAQWEKFVILEHQTRASFSLTAGENAGLNSAHGTSS
jgi:hypothetical protein